MALVETNLFPHFKPFLSSQCAAFERAVHCAVSYTILVPFLVKSISSRQYKSKYTAQGLDLTDAPCFGLLQIHPCLIDLGRSESEFKQWTVCISPYCHAFLYVTHVTDLLIASTWGFTRQRRLCLQMGSRSRKGSKTPPQPTLLVPITSDDDDLLSAPSDLNDARLQSSRHHLPKPQSFSKVDDPVTSWFYDPASLTVFGLASSALAFMALYGSEALKLTLKLRSQLGVLSGIARCD